MCRRLIVGDIHSRYEKLIAVLDMASYNPESDILFSVGDFCDRGDDAVKTLRFLMDQRNLRAVIGNHDIYLQDWLYTGYRDDNWVHYNGGNKTIKDFVYRNKVQENERISIASWLRAIPLVRIEDDFIIVHGGIPGRMKMKDLLELQQLKRSQFSLMFKEEAVTWDRDYMLSAYTELHPEVKDDMFFQVEPFDTDKTIFLGHTPTLDGKPFISERYHLVAIDTGAGSKWPLTLMDIYTLKYWQA